MGDNNSSTIVSNTVNGGGNEVIVEIDKMLDELEPPPSFECCIYRVPMEIRKVNEEAYTPRIVSIGPFHHNNKKLESMEQVKKSYMRKLVRRNGNSSLTECFDFVKNREADIRKCYSENIYMNSTEFNLMVLVDSCFIIQFLIFYCNNWEYRDYDDSLYLEKMPRSNLILDLILLENQVPFFVLEELFSLTTSSSREAYSFCQLAINFLNKTKNLHFFGEFEKYNHGQNFQPIKHFTHLVLTLCHPLPQLPRPKYFFRTLCSFTNLADTGATFRKQTSNEVFDITFTNGVLEIPCIWLTDDTETQIRNLMALELCSNPENRFVTDYFVFMDCLINSTRDVNLLVDNEIIIHNLGDNKVAADFFNKLCNNIQYDPSNFYFSQVCKELNYYYKAPMQRLKEMLNRDYIYTLKRDYCNTPWKTTATIGAIMLLLLTLIQTACSILSAIKDK